MRRPASRFALVLALAAAPPAAGQDDPWALVAACRDHLAAAPLVADFVQTYVPAGFDSGETETGGVALALPDLLRWDYGEPQPRTFLVQSATVSTWNEGEATGRRFALASEEARHLDLMRLDADELRRRYRAEVVGGDEEAIEVRLLPLADDDSLAEATLRLGRSVPLPLALAYRDREGNATRFDLSGFRPLADPDRFLAPSGLEWIED